MKFVGNYTPNEAINPIWFWKMVTKKINFWPTFLNRSYIWNLILIKYIVKHVVVQVTCLAGWYLTPF